MTTQPDNNSGDLAAVNGICNSLSVRQCIESQTHPDLKRRRGIDFAAIDGAIAAAERLVAAHGPDVPLPFGGAYRGATPAGLLIHVKGIAELAAPYRPAKAEARRA